LEGLLQDRSKGWAAALQAARTYTVPDAIVPMHVWILVAVPHHERDALRAHFRRILMRVEDLRRDEDPQRVMDVAGTPHMWVEEHLSLVHSAPYIRTVHRSLEQGVSDPHWKDVEVTRDALDRAYAGASTVCHAVDALMEHRTDTALAVLPHGCGHHAGGDVAFRVARWTGRRGRSAALSSSSSSTSSSYDASMHGAPGWGDVWNSTALAVRYLQARTDMVQAMNRAPRTRPRIIIFSTTGTYPDGTLRLLQPDIRGRHVLLCSMHSLQRGLAPAHDTPSVDLKTLTASNVGADGNVVQILCPTTLNTSDVWHAWSRLWLPLFQQWRPDAVVWDAGGRGWRNVSTRVWRDMAHTMCEVLPPRTHVCILSHARTHPSVEEDKQMVKTLYDGTRLCAARGVSHVGTSIHAMKYDTAACAPITRDVERLIKQVKTAHGWSTLEVDTTTRAGSWRSHA
jgi:acetoin utilization deacetylase AcuC-like enzyme